MRKDSVDDNHSYPSIGTPRRHFETLVRTRLLHYKLENWLSIYSRGLFRCLTHFIMHVACYVRWWWSTLGKGNPYTHKLIKTLAFSGCWREYVILRKKHQSIKWNNVDKLHLLFQIVLGDDSSYNRPFHGFFQPFGMDKLRMIHLGLRWKKRLSIAIVPSLNTKSFVEN